MTDRGYDALNQGKRLACPRCDEDRPGQINPSHDGTLLCLTCRTFNEAEAFREAGSPPVVIQ